MNNLLQGRDDPLNPDSSPPPSDAFSWPGPPYAGYQNQDLPLACEVKGTNGTVRTCLLTGMDLQAQTAYVCTPPGKTVFRLGFAQFIRLTVTPVLPPLADSGTASTQAVEELLKHRPISDYTLQMADGTKVTGQTVGHVENEWGLFLFHPADSSGAVRRIFFPKTAYASVKFGPLIGQVLVAQQAASELQVESAAAEQERLRKRKLGNYLIANQIVTPEQLMAALEKQKNMPVVRTGEALLSMGLVTEDQLAQALQEQQREQMTSLGELLVRRGVITSRDLQAALARKMGYPMVNVTKFPLDESALRKVPFALARRLKILPLLLREGVLIIAIENPSNHKAIEEIEFTVQSKVALALGDPVNIVKTVISAYENLNVSAVDVAGKLAFDGINLVEFDPEDVNKLVDSLELQQKAQKPAESEIVISQSDNSLVKLINSMILDAHNKGVSDIHIETQSGASKVLVRFRKDGMLSHYLELPPSYRSAMVSRIKIMADLDISEKRLPQDGKIDFSKFSPPDKIELRVATIPTRNGLEDIVLRILTSAKPLALSELGLSEGNYRRLLQAVERPYGMVLCVGPTGSGKTTTLHSVLRHLNTADRKIWTAEDPIEITQNGVRQVQVNPKIGWTFARALRAFLRADPDIIMVGEIRDTETAQMAIEASLTGHLVLSTLHTNSAPETITRLLDMGMDPFSFGDSLLAVLGQRLIRKLCTKCKVSRPMESQQLSELLDDYLHSFSADSRPSREALQQEWLQRFGINGKLMHFEAPGCSHCEGTGMKGRMGVHELMIVTPNLRHLIQTGARPDELMQEAMTRGELRTLRHDGVEKILAGLVTLKEVRATCN